MNSHQQRKARRAFKRDWPLGRKVRSKIIGNVVTIAGHGSRGDLRLRDPWKNVFWVHVDYLELCHDD